MTVRLIHLSPYATTYAGSFIPMVRAIASAARRRGWDVDVVFGTDSAACDWVQDFEQDGIQLRFVPLQSRRHLRREVRALLDEKTAPTILHTHFTTFDVPAALAARGRAKTAVFWHLHSAARTDTLGWVRGVVKLGLFGRLTDRILCVAPDLAEAARLRGAPRSRVLFVPNATDTSAFGAATPSERAVARGRLALPEQTAVLLHFGWDWHRKGGDLFLGAIRELRDRGRQVTGLTVGAGDEARKLTQQLGLDDAVAIRPAENHVQVLYAAADLLASPSRAEGTPFSMLEALASSMPVAASTIPGQEAVGRSLGACRLVRLDATALADGIASLLDRDEETAAADAAAAVLRIRTEYDLSAWADRLLGLYDEVLRDDAAQSCS